MYALNIFSDTADVGNTEDGLVSSHEDDNTDVGTNLRATAVQHIEVANSTHTSSGIPSDDYDSEDEPF